MRYKGETMQANGGHVPTCASTNRTVGVFRHHCGDVANVLKPKGRKAHLHYLICKTCGTDQCAGKPYQQKIRDNMQPNIEALEAFEDSQAKPELTEVLTENNAITEPPKTTVDAVQGDIEPTAKPEPESVEQAATVKPLETANAAVTGNESPQTIKPITEQVKPKVTEQPQHPKSEKKTALYMVFGALFGGLFALAR